MGTLVVMVAVAARVGCAATGVDVTVGIRFWVGWAVAVGSCIVGLSVLVGSTFVEVGVDVALFVWSKGAADRFQG